MEEALTTQRLVPQGNPDVILSGLWAERGHIFRRLAEGAFDEADLIRRTHELAAFIEQATQRYALDEKRITAIGFSNGANIAALAVFLASDAGKSISGQMLPIDNDMQKAS